MIKRLSELGLLGPDTTYIHCCYFSDEEWQLVADSGGTISLAPQVELQMGHGWAPVVKSMQYGLRPSLSIDVVTTVPGDMFTQIRAAFASERARVNAVWWEKNEPAEGLLTAADMLKMATVNGAHVAGLESRTGSLTPGKKADVVVIETKSLNMAPIHDPEAAVALCADTSNVETVIVNGSIKKRNGKLLGDVDRARRLVQASRDYLVEETERRKQVAAAAAT
jgi:cytosine/adenosine deaminase-related metal-dependent hydrolase